MKQQDTVLARVAALKATPTAKLTRTMKISGACQLHQ